MLRTWISPSKTRNWLMGDPILDYFELFYNPNGTKKNKQQSPSLNSNNNFRKNLFEEGYAFEHAIVEKIKTKFCNDFVEVQSTDSFEKRFITTKLLLESKQKIIYQGVLMDNEKMIRGIPDLIVHKTAMPKLFESLSTILDDEYYIVDIKNSTIPFRANGETMLNSGSAPAFKGQLYLYTWMLGKIFNKEPSFAFVLGKNNSFSIPGTIDYAGVDESYKENTWRATQWLTDLYTNGHTFELTPKPNRPELYPNMSYSYDQPWGELKEKIAREIGEISLLWQCGPKQRAIAHQQGIYNWKECTAEMLGIKGDRALIINSMIEINKQMVNIISPNQIINNDREWRTVPSIDVTEMFLDFETIDDRIFLIGVGHLTWTGKRTRHAHKNNSAKNWTFKYFLATNNDTTSEKQIIEEFIAYIRSFKKVQLYHWANAEKQQLESAASRHKLDLDFIINSLFDMKNIFTKEPIVVRNCFGFALKPIAKELYSAGYIQTKWDSNCTDGLTAMISAKLAYQQNDQAVLQDIVKYNECDCKVLYEIIHFLRTRPDMNIVDEITVCDPDDDIIITKKPKQTILNIDDDEMFSSYGKKTIKKHINTLQQLLQYKNSITTSVDEILSADCDIMNKYRALILHYDLEESDAAEYFGNCYAIRKLINGEILFGREPKNQNIQELRTNAKILDEYRKQYENQCTTIKDIINTELTQKQKYRAVQLYDIRMQCAYPSEEFFDAENNLKTFLETANKNEESIIDKLDCSQEIKDTIRSTITSRDEAPIESKEHYVSKVRTMLALPYNKVSNNITVPIREYIYQYKSRLDEKLYGMDKIKTQLVQIMIEKLIGSKNSQVLGLCGPPGIGKSAICKAHAYAANLPYYFCNIGSTQDATKLKGSDAVYSGSGHGTIVAALKTMKVSNGIVIFDEIDKINRDHSFANVNNTLLEILDPTQNSHFSDDFIHSIPIDLSRITFICTMNDRTLLDPILQDRIKILHCDGYSAEEKINIVRKFFIPKDYIISDSTLKIAINGSKTMNGVVEQGVRSLEKIIKSTLSWINILATMYDEANPEQFDLLVGDEYKKYPRMTIVLPFTIPEKLVSAVCESLKGTVIEEPPQHLYL